MFMSLQTLLLTDQVIVKGAEIVPYSIEAKLTIQDGPDQEMVFEAARKSAERFAQDHWN